MKLCLLSGRGEGRRGNRPHASAYFPRTLIPLRRKKLSPSVANFRANFLDNADSSGAERCAYLRTISTGYISIKSFQIYHFFRSACLLCAPPYLVFEGN